MITVIIFDVLIFLIGFIGGYLYKTVFFRPKLETPIYQPYYNAPEQLYMPDSPCKTHTTDDLEFELKQVRTLLSANLFNLALQSGRISEYMYKEYGGDYKELKLKELALIEKINKINKDNGVTK